MSKTIRSHIAQEKEKYRVPRSVQDTIPIKKFWSDGIFLVGNKYSKTFKFTDINFQMASAEDKRGMMEHYAELINSLDPAATTKITINSRRVLQSEIRDNILLPDIDDELKIYRDELNEFLKMRAAASGGFQQEKYITVSVSKRNVDEARAYFSRIESMLSAKLKALGSKCVPLDDNQRLRILHNLYRDGEDDHFFYDPKHVYRKGHNVKDYICPDYIEKNNDYLKLGDTFCRVMYLKEWAGIGRGPHNGVTKACYRGCNAFYLSLVSMAKGYTDPRWVTMTQIMDKEKRYHPNEQWHLKKGSKASYVEYWYPYDVKNKKALTWEQYREDIKNGRNEKEFSLSTWYTAVFNAAEVEGMPEYQMTENPGITQDELIGRLSTGMGVLVFTDGGDSAYYTPTKDEIHIPTPESFFTNML